MIDPEWASYQFLGYHHLKAPRGCCSVKNFFVEEITPSSPMNVMPIHSFRGEISFVALLDVELEALMGVHARGCFHLAQALGNPLLCLVLCSPMEVPASTSSLRCRLGIICVAGWARHLCPCKHVDATTGGVKQILRDGGGDVSALIWLLKSTTSPCGHSLGHGARRSK